MADPNLTTQLSIDQAIFQHVEGHDFPPEHFQYTDHNGFDSIRVLANASHPQIFDIMVSKSDAEEALTQSEFWQMHLILKFLT